VSFLRGGGKMIRRIVMVVAALAPRIAGGGGVVTHRVGSTARLGSARESTATNAQNPAHRNLVVGLPTGGGKYPFLVAVAWKDPVSDPRVRILTVDPPAESPGLVTYHVDDLPRIRGHSIVKAPWSRPMLS
jgi:hypothetical protein